MTSKVTIEAHCAPNKEVEVSVLDGGARVERVALTNGEKAERYVFDDRVVLVQEREREQLKT